MTESLRSEEVRSIAAQQRGRPSAESQDEAAFDYAANRFPYSIVWQPFPVLGWILPCIGHMGIADSQGVVYDFQGPYTIIADSMMLGRASRYIPLSPEHVRNGDPNHDAESAGREQTAQEKYDWCVRQGNCDYEKRVHCLIYPNCNHHVAHCLSCMSYRGWNHYGMITLWFWIFFAGRFAGLRGFLETFIPFGLVVAAVLLLGVGLGDSDEEGLPTDDGR